MRARYRVRAGWLLVCAGLRLALGDLVPAMVLLGQAKIVMQAGLDEAGA